MVAARDRYRGAPILAPLILIAAELACIKGFPRIRLMDGTKNQN